MVVGNNNYNNLNGNNNLNNNGRFRGIARQCQDYFMDDINLWESLCSYENLETAFERAKKRKSSKLYVLEFEKDLENNLLLLRSELLLHSYSPLPLKSFVLRDPKTRKISVSAFRDRIVHHAVCNIIEPIFEKVFIFDSYANRKGKGTLKALARFDCFKRKVSQNNTRACFVLKADIFHYFDEVSHELLLKIIKKRISDSNVRWLIRKILCNYCTHAKSKGMPLGNLTSQFFANVYLNELDYYVKHHLRIRYYVRYVDDFVILDNSVRKLAEYKEKIGCFLSSLELKLHPDKSKVCKLDSGICFLGFRIFYHHRLLKKSNIHKFERKFRFCIEQCRKNIMSYDDFYAVFEGWLAYAANGNTYFLRKSFVSQFETEFLGCIADVEINRWLNLSKN